MTTPHANSHKITIFRALTPLQKMQGADMTEYFDMVKVSVGSYLAGATQGMQQGCGGMEWKLQQLLLPHIVGIDKDDRIFRETVNTFWAEMDTKVPMTGVELEIGLEEDNDQPVGLNNLPINISEYVKYIHHRGHPNMARNQEEAQRNQLMLYYIFDPMEQQRSKSKETKDKDAALKIYLQLMNEPEKMDMMITMFGEDPRESEIGKTKEEWIDRKTQRLRELCNSQPVNFIQHYKTEDLEMQYWIARLIKLDVFTEVGTQVRAKDSKALIGHTRAEAVAFFQNPENQELVMMFKALAQEAAKRAPVQGIKQTILTARQLAGKNGQ